jgi:hypothetical protein
MPKGIVIFFFLFQLLPLGLGAQEEGVVDYAPSDSVSTKNRAFKFGFSCGLELGRMAGTAQPSDTAQAVFSKVNTPLAAGLSTTFFIERPLHRSLIFRGGVGLTLLPTQLVYTRQSAVSSEELAMLHVTADVSGYLRMKRDFENHRPWGVIGLAAEFDLIADPSSKVQREEAVGRIELGFGFQLRLNNTKARVEVTGSQTLSPLLSNETIYEQWWQSLSRQRLSLRLFLD